MNSNETAPKGGPIALDSHIATDSVAQQTSSEVEVSERSEYFGLYSCSSCSRQWDSIFFRSTICTCGASGNPLRPPRDPLEEAMSTGKFQTRWDAFWAMHYEWRRSKAPRRRLAQNGIASLGKGNARARLRGLVTTVQDAPVGTRNATLHWAACRAGEMIAAGELDETTAVAVLQDVATEAGLTSREIGDLSHGTIGSGLRAGIGGAV